MRLLPGGSSGLAHGERPDRPFTGYKLAHAVLSADGERAGFAGLTMGASRVYGVLAEADCVWNSRHHPPRRWCGCGFYCLHSLSDALSLSCATENRSAVLLEITASGRYIRYERGLRYSRQRIRSIAGSRCVCGNQGGWLADAGSGLIGWRHLAPVCERCAAGRPAISIRDFTARLDGRVGVALGQDQAGGPATPGPLSPEPLSPGSFSPGPPGPGSFSPEPLGPEPLGPGPLGARPAGPAPAEAGAGRGAGAGSVPVQARPEESPFAVLAAEIALLHARLDDLQSRLDR